MRKAEATAMNPARLPTQKFGQRRWPVVIAGSLILLLNGCRSQRSVVMPTSPQALEISTLWWIFFGVTAAVYLAVMAFLVVAIFRTKRNAGSPDSASTVAQEPARESRFRRNVGLAVGLSALILVGLLF